MSVAVAVVATATEAGAGAGKGQGHRETGHRGSYKLVSARPMTCPGASRSLVLMNVDGKCINNWCREPQECKRWTIYDRSDRWVNMIMLTLSLEL